MNININMKRTLSILFSLIFTMGSLFTYSAYAKNNKVAICHYLGEGNGNPEFIVIVVSERAAVSHIRQHGDYYLNNAGNCNRIE